ncbi:MAG: leucine-rich repeat domain-containing protein [Eubacteriales bacterium]
MMFHTVKKRICVTLCIVLIAAFFPTVSTAQNTVIDNSAKSTTKAATQGIQPNGEVVVYLFQDNKWQETGSLPFDKNLRQQKLNLGKFLLSAEPVKMLLKQKGGGAAHLDSVFLGGTTPDTVNNGTGLPLTKLSKSDLDVINIDANGVELAFPANTMDKVLTVTARIESVNISKTPFQFPTANNYRTMSKYSSFYSYKLNAKPVTLKTGTMVKAVSSQKPFFKEYCVPGSGHPQGYTYGWVTNDNKNLYVVIDFTSDNTMDGDKDYAKVYVKTAAGVKEFKVSVPETKWGKPFFTYTDKVAYQHKVYEFAIPFTEVGISSLKGGTVPLAFATYGTAALGAQMGPAIACNTRADQYLLVYEKNVEYPVNRAVYGQLISKDGVAVNPEFPISTSDGFQPAVAYDSSNNRYFVVWETVTGNVYGQILAPDGTRFAGANGENNFVISNAPPGDGPAGSRNPSVSFDSLNQYLVVWSAEGRIRGQLVDAYGTLSGTPSDVNFSVSDTVNNKFNPKTAFDRLNGRFLVVWENQWTDELQNTYSAVYGQLLNTDGTSCQNPGNTDSFVISQSAETKQHPDLAFDDTNGRFLVTWDSFYGAVYGQFVKSDGSLFPSSESNFQVSSSYYGQYPSVAFDSITKEYFVAWQDYYNIRGRIIKADGTPNLSGDLSITSSLYDSSSNPVVAFNPNGPNFMVGYQYNSYPSQINTHREVTPAQIAAGAIDNEPVNIPDPYLKEAVRSKLNKPQDSPITYSDMAALTVLNAVYSGITDLTGLEAATNLRRLYLSNNQIYDITPLQGLTTLEELYLDHNQIWSITPLANMINMRWLNLSSNQILYYEASGIAPLAGLVNLQSLYLSDNSDLSGIYRNISNIDALSNLTALQELWLDHNEIDNVAPLAALPALRVLGLQSNPIWDIFPSNLPLPAYAETLEYLYLNNTGISEMGLPDLSGFTSLKGLCLSGDYLWNDDISNLQSLTGLKELWLDHNNINTVSSLVYLPNLEVLGLHDNGITDISPLENLTNLNWLFLQNIWYTGIENDIQSLCGTVKNVVYTPVN